jgi:general secretion pathway protein G
MTHIKPFSQRLGFTLIEMMIIVTIIGILSLIVGVKYNEALIASKEAATKGNLAGLRGSLSIYYSDMDGQYPLTLASLSSGQKTYIGIIPETSMPSYHSDTYAEMDGSSGVIPNDIGGWAYVNNVQDSKLGTLWVNCTHTDSKGSLWNSY